MALRWNNDIQDYEDVSGYGYATTPALRASRESNHDFSRGWQDKLRNVVDSLGAWQEQYPGVPDTAGHEAYLDASDDYKKAAWQRRLNNQLFGVNADTADTLRRQSTFEFEKGLAQARQEHLNQRIIAQTDPVGPTQKATKALGMTDKNFDLPTLYDAVPDYYYEAKLPLQQRMLDQYRATGDERFNPSKQRAISFARLSSPWIPASGQDVQRKRTARLWRVG